MREAVFVIKLKTSLGLWNVIELKFIGKSFKRNQLFSCRTRVFVQNHERGSD